MRRFILLSVVSVGFAFPAMVSGQNPATAPSVAATPSATAPAPAASNAQTVERLFATPTLKPVQSDIDIDTPTTQAEFEKCKILETPEGFLVRDGSDKLLRAFLRKGTRSIVQWSYYKNGVEVYRQFTEDKDPKAANQYRWLNNAGTRWGIDDNADQVIDRWKMISAEELSAEVVAAFATQDVKRFLRLAPTQEEIAALGLGKDQQVKVAKKIEQMSANFAAAAKAIGFPKTAKWVQFSGGQPGIVPSDKNANQADIIAYENAVALVQVGETPKQISLATLVKIGENNWRIIGVPQLDNPDSQDVPDDFTFFPSGVTAEMQGTSQGTTQTAGPSDEVLKKIDKIQEIQANVQKVPADQRPALHSDILNLTLQVAESATTTEDSDMWIKQAANLVMAGVQANEFPEGPKKLEILFTNVKDQLKRPETAAYIKYRQIMADYFVQLFEGSDAVKIHATWMENLEKFAKEFESTEGAAEAMLELAAYKEMIQQENDALVWYRKVEKDFPNKSIGERAAGAVRRITSVGKEVPFTGKAANGAIFNISQFKGSIIVLYFWASWSDPESKNLKTIADRYKDVKIIGVNLDKTPEAMSEYLKANGVTFPQIQEPGDLESKPALYWGVKSPPMMILFDKTGKVEKQNLTTSADLLKAIEEMNKK